MIGAVIASGAATAALVVLPFVVKADTFATVTSDIIAIGTVLLFILAVVTLRRDSTESKGGRRIKARGRGAIAAGRDATGNATGSGAKAKGGAVPKPISEPAAADVEQLVVEAHGAGALAAGQDVSGNATGKQSEAS